ncbi:MAG: hypothetical protein ACX939_02710 [Hyphococcus sp.]
MEQLRGKEKPAAAHQHCGGRTAVAHCVQQTFRASPHNRKEILRARSPLLFFMEGRTSAQHPAFDATLEAGDAVRLDLIGQAV